MHYKLILASNSPRRKELLSGLDLPYEIRLLPGIEETYPASLQGGDIPLFLSQLKAKPYLSTLRPDELLITADTIVWLDGQVLGKPKDDADAMQMLGRLSGRTHEVFTGVSLTTTRQQKSFSAVSKVTFAALSEAEIRYYVSHYHPLDKAGAYGVQEWVGYVGVERIEGSYYNVMGLPVQRLYRELQKFLEEA